MPQAGQSAFGLGNLLGGFLRVLTGSAVGLRSFGGLSCWIIRGCQAKSICGIVNSIGVHWELPGLAIGTGCRVSVSQRSQRTFLNPKTLALKRRKQLPRIIKIRSISK